MPKLSEKSGRRESTSVRDNEIHRLYLQIIGELGGLANVVSKSYIYGENQGENEVEYQNHILYIKSHETFISLCKNFLFP